MTGTKKDTSNVIDEELADKNRQLTEELRQLQLRL